MHIETFENLLLMVTPYIEKEDSHLRPFVTAANDCTSLWDVLIQVLADGVCYL